jgi:hypothetical protein
LCTALSEDSYEVREEEETDKTQMQARREGKKAGTERPILDLIYGVVIGEYRERQDSTTSKTYRESLW